MKVKMLIVSFLVMGFGLVLYGCSNKLSTENSYPIYTVRYLDTHPKLVNRLKAECDKTERSFGNNVNEAVAFENTNLSKDCTEIIQSVNPAAARHHYAAAVTSNAINNTMPSAPADSSVLYDLPHYNKK